MSLKTTLEIIEKIASISGRKEKELLVEKAVNSDPYFERVVKLAYDPLLRFNTTKVSYTPNTDSDTGMVLDYLDYLATQRGCDNLKMEQLSNYSSVDPETTEVVQRIINKDLRCGAGLGTFSKFTDLTKFELMLCDKVWNKFWKAAKTWSNLVWSIKMDGVRCSAVISENLSVTYLSRTGKTWGNFEIFDPYFIEAAKQLIDEGFEFPICFDGEVVTKDVNFQKLMTKVHKHGEIDVSSLRFYVFDLICDKEFVDRYDHLCSLFQVSSGNRGAGRSSDNSSYIVHALKHNLAPGFTCYKDIEDTAKEIISDGNEGIVVKTLDGPYERKRSKHWLKIKGMYIDGKRIEVDLPVIRWEYGTGRNANVVGKLICSYKGKEVAVGSGLSDEDRLDFMTNTPKIIEVWAQGETQDASLWYPTFQRVRDDK